MMPVDAGWRSTVAWFDHPEARIYYEESGSGDPLLLLPGWGGTIDELAPLRAALTPTHRVIAADVPGSGRSGPQPRTYPPTYYRDDAQVFLAMLDAIGAAPAHLVGFSDGGEYALLMAALRPDAVRSIVTWGSAGTLGDNPEIADLFSGLVDDPIPPMVGFATYLTTTYGDDNARIMVRSAAAAMREIIRAGGDISRSRAASIACPALLITGDHDFLATPALVADMAHAIPGGEFRVAKDAGHGVHHDQPEWLATTIADWLAER
jgi:valacyclovir hydrolase